MSWSPPGASSRELSERHGVGVGGAMSVAPASVRRSVAAAASAHPERHPDVACHAPADLDPVDVLGVGDVGQLERGATGIEDHDVARAVVERRQLRQPQRVAVEGDGRRVVLGRHHEPHLEHAIRHGPTLR